MAIWKSWKYKNLTFLLLGVIFAFALARLENFHLFLQGFGNLGLIGAFLAGILFVSSFTIPTSIVILLILAEKLSAWEIGLTAGVGAMFGDLTIFRFVKDRLTAEVKPLFNQFGGRHLLHLLHSKYFSWSLPLIGALIIASPLPDEIGISLLTLSKMKTYQFLIVSFVLNTIGIILIISSSYIIKP